MPERPDPACGHPPAVTGPEAIGNLRELLDILRVKEESSFEQQLRVLARSLAETYSHLDEPGTLGPDYIEDLIRRWTHALRRGLELGPPPDRILCGFSSVLDVSYTLDARAMELNAFIDWVAGKLRKQRQPLLAEIQALIDAGCRRKVEEKEVDLLAGDGQAFDLIDVLAILLWCMATGTGKKPALRCPELWELMREYIGDRKARNAKIIYTLGGAAGNMCYVLRHLELEVAAHWHYHPAALATASPYCLKRLEIEAGVKRERSADQKGVIFDAAGTRNEHPVRHSFAFEFPSAMPFPEGLSLKGPTGPAMRSSQGRNRVIYRIPLHLSEANRGWKDLLLRLTSPGGGSIDLLVDPVAVQRELRDRGWPFLPLFGHPRIEPTQRGAGALVFEVAGDDVMRHVGEQFDYFIATGLQGLGGGLMNAGVHLGSGKPGSTVGTIVKHALLRQLQVLADAGVVIHTEIPATSPELFDILGEVIRGRIKSVGINDDDLFAVTGDERYRGSRYFFGERRVGEREGEGGLERSRMIHRRYQRAVHLAVQLDVDELYVHGNDVDLIVRRHTSRGGLRWEVQADLFAKGVVILALLQRSAGERWEEEAQALPPLLSENGFVSLIEFARALALDRHPNESAVAQRLFRRLLETGYLFERDPQGYSVILVPVLWPTPEPEIGTTGAGDITSSVVAIFAGK